MQEWITGRNPVYETLRAGRRRIDLLRVAQGTNEKGRLSDILALAGKRQLEVERVPRNRFDHLGDPGSHQGVALQVGHYPYADLADIPALAVRRGEPLFVLALDALQNPQNLGTLLRTAEAVGVHGVIMPAARSAGVTPAVVHASSGATEHLRVAQSNLVQAIEALKAEDAWVAGLDMDPSSKPLGQADLGGPLVLVVGSEGEGLRRLVAKSCDYIIHLPMSGAVESLNAAVAGSIVLYQVYQARS